MCIRDRVFTSGTGTIYAVPHPSPLLTGPGPSGITALGHQNVVGWVVRPGRYTLRIRYSGYWRVWPASACVRRTSFGMMTLEMRSPGAFTLTFPDTATAVLASVGDAERRCAS